MRFWEETYKLVSFPVALHLNELFNRDYNFLVPVPQKLSEVRRDAPNVPDDFNLFVKVSLVGHSLEVELVLLFHVMKTLSALLHLKLHKTSTTTEDCLLPNL